VQGGAQSEPSVGALVRARPPIVRKSETWALVIPTVLSVGVAGRGGPDEVVASCRHALFPGATLGRSTRSEPAGDPRSLDPSEAPEQLHDLFNREGAISRCIVPLPGVRRRIALSHPQRDAEYKRSPLATTSHWGCPDQSASQVHHSGTSCLCSAGNIEVCST
jgi:hypothetical protein